MFRGCPSCVCVCACVFSLPQRGSIGDRLFTSGWQLTLMKRMKKRLTETADHYGNAALQCDVISTAETTHDVAAAQRRQLYEKLNRCVAVFDCC